MNNRSRLKINVLHKLVQYHEEIEQFIPVIAKLVGWIRTGKGSEARKEFISFCQKDIEEHFDFEEKIIFPVIFNGNAQKKIRFELIKVHHEIRGRQKTVELLFDELSENVVADTVKKLEVAIVGFISSCKAHAEFENTTVVPLIEKNPGAYFAIGRIALQQAIDVKNKNAATESMPPKPEVPADKKGDTPKNVISLENG